MNVILLTTDALRADFMYYPDGNLVAPSLHKFAHGSTIFERTFTIGTTTPFSFPAVPGVGQCPDPKAIPVPQSGVPGKQHSPGKTA